MQIITVLRRTIIPEVFLRTSSRYVLFAPSSSRKLPEGAETARNSFDRNILQGTSLFSIFCSATLLVTSRKQGFCAQSMGGGTRCSSFVVTSRPTVSDANLLLSTSRLIVIFTPARIPWPHQNTSYLMTSSSLCWRILPPSR